MTFTAAKHFSALIFKSRKTAVAVFDTNFRIVFFGAFQCKLFKLFAAGKGNSHHDTCTVNSLSAVEVKSFTDYLNIENPLIIRRNKQHFARSARNMKGDKFFFYKFCFVAGKQSGGYMPRLMRKTVNRFIHCGAYAVCGIDTHKKAWHIRAFGISRFFRNTYRINLCTVFIKQLFHQRIKS